MTIQRIELTKNPTINNFTKKLSNDPTTKNFKISIIQRKPGKPKLLNQYFPFDDNNLKKLNAKTSRKIGAPKKNCF